MSEATVPASEYDALAETFRHYVAEINLIGENEVDASDLADVLIGRGLSQEEVGFLGRALQQGSRALRSRAE